MSEELYKKCRFKVEKLLRDKIPNKLNSLQVHLFKRVMEHDEYVQSLKNKLFEEAEEVLDAKNNEEVLEECADVIEVIYAFAAIHGFSIDDLERRRIAKKEKNGGFDDRIYGELIEMDCNNPRITYYRERPEKYPEII